MVKIVSFTTNTVTLNTEAPQGCVLSILLYSQYTHNCVATHRYNTTGKFADETVVVDLITKNAVQAFVDNVERLAL